MRTTSILFVFIIFLFSCGKTEPKKESKKFQEPAVEQTVPKVDVEKNTDNQEQTSELIFTVQIAALRKQNQKLEAIYGLRTYEENSLTKYRLGNFKTYSEAKSFRLQLLNKYEDAFVQALKNGEPIAITEALQE